MSATDSDDRPPLDNDALIERLRAWFSIGRSPPRARYLVVRQDLMDYFRYDDDDGLYPKYAANRKALQKLLDQDARRKADSLEDRVVDVFDLERDLDDLLCEPSQTEFHFLR